MIRIFNIVFLILVLTITLSTGVEFANAGKSITVTRDRLPLLNYFWEFSRPYTSDTVPLSTETTGCSAENTDCGWTKGLERNSVVNVTYKAKLINLDTNQEISDRATVPVGTRFRVVRDTSTMGTDISWNGTGWSTDSPYGNWVSNAGPRRDACHAEDFLNSSSYSVSGMGLSRTFDWNTYVLLNVNPTTPVVVNPSANISCSGDTCTVNQSGSVSVGLKFPDTYGKFYYRYSGFSSWGPETNGCHANNVPMRQGSLSTEDRFARSSTLAGGNYCIGANCIAPSNVYTVTVPERTITFRLDAEASNNPPTPPVVNPNPLNGFTRIGYTIMFTTTDPDPGDRVRFGVDWNNDGTTDQYQPAPGFSSSMNQAVSRTWNTPGTYNYKVRAEDNRGGVSGWTTAVANITLPSPTGLTAVPNGVCGSGSINVSWSSVPGAASYTLRDGNTDIYTGSSVSFTHTGLASASTHSYTVRANHASGNSVYSAVVTQSAPADCGAPNLTTLTAPNCTIEVGASTCTTPVTWVVENAITPKVTQNGSTIGSTPTGTNISSGPIHFGIDSQNTITVTDTNGPLGQVTPEGICALGAMWDGTVCAQANLTSGTVVTPDPLTQNTDVVFEAPVTNSGSVATGNAFRDEFSYQWGVTTGIWNSINTINNSSLNASGAYTDTSGLFTLVNTGTLYVQHCVDVTNTVVESDESNCTVTSFTVVAPNAGTPEATLTAPSCVIQKGNSSCDTTVTWTSTNVPTPSVRREGIEFSNNPNSNTPQTITYVESPVTFTFSDGTTDLVTVNTGAGCADGLVWDGDSCELPATGTITANPPVVPRGGTTNITWTTTNATNCTVAGGADSWTGTADTKPSSPLFLDTTYVLICDGRPLDSVFVDVQGPDINATPRVVPKVGDPVTVSWNPWGVPGCVVNGGGLTNVDASTPGSQSGVIINGNTVFTLTCGGVVEDRARVEVVGRGFET